MSLAYNPIPRFPYEGTALPGNAEVVTLFATAPTYTAGVSDGNDFASSAGELQRRGIHRILLTLTNSQAGTIKVYQSPDRGRTWTQVIPSIAAAATVANSVDHYDFLVESFPDVKLEWTNGAVAQTVFTVNIVGSDQRAVTT